MAYPKSTITGSTYPMPGQAYGNPADNMPTKRVEQSYAFADIDPDYFHDSEEIGKSMANYLEWRKQVLEDNQELSEYSSGYQILGIATKTTFEYPPIEEVEQAVENYQELEARKQAGRIARYLIEHLNGGGDAQEDLDNAAGDQDGTIGSEGGE